MCDAGQHIQHDRRDRKRFVRKTSSDPTEVNAVWQTVSMPCSLYWHISKHINQVEICICNDLTRSDWVVWSEAAKHIRSVSQSFSQSMNQSSASVVCVSDVFKCQKRCEVQRFFLSVLHAKAPLTQSVCHDDQMPRSEGSYEAMKAPQWTDRRSEGRLHQREDRQSARQI